MQDHRWGPMALMIGMCVMGWGAPEAPAADTEEEPVPVRDVIISATKTEIDASKATSAVEVIRGEEMERKKFRSVLDALRLAQGITAFQSGGPGNIATVQMRGTKSAHTMVVIDGVIANSPNSGLFNFGNLSADNIERIEILRGAQSMLWGSDAMGGVIHIITKKGSGAPTANAFLEYGSFATLREGLSASGARGPFDFSFTLTRWDTSSFSSTNYQRGAYERDGFHNWNTSARIGAALPHHGRLDLTVRWWNADVDFDGQTGNSEPADMFGSRQTTRNLLLSGVYEQPITDWWSQKLTLAQGTERFMSQSGPAGFNVTTGQPIVPDPFCGFPAPAGSCFFPFAADFKTINRRLEWQHNVQIGKPLLLTAGYQFREEFGDNAQDFGADSAKRRIASNAGFAQAQVNLQDRLLLTAGIRYDSYNTFGDATTYRVTAGYHIHETGTKLRGSYATGFKAPTLNDLFFQSGGFPVSNPNLKPERSQSLDAGLDQSLWKGRVLLSGGYFWNHFRDLIQFPLLGAPSLCPPETFGFCPVNIAAARTQGWEFSGKISLMDGLELKAQYTNTHARDLTTGKRLARWPVDQASVGLAYQPIAPLHVFIDYRFVGARNNDIANSPGQRLGSFGVVNVAASYDLTKRWQIYGRIDNLLGQDYEEILTFGTPIRSVFGGIKFTY